MCHVVSPKRLGTTWNDYLFSLYKTTQTTLTTYTTQTTLTTLDDKEVRLFKKIDNIGVYGRALELFFPLIIISDFFGEEVVDKTLELAKKSFEDRNKDEFNDNPDITLLDFLWRKYADGYNLEYIKLTDILGNFKLENNSFNELDIRSLGRMMQRLNIILDKKRDMSGRKVMLDIVKIKQKLERYGK